MTVGEVLGASAEYLPRKGVDTPRLDAELILAQRSGVRGSSSTRARSPAERGRAGRRPARSSSAAAAASRSPTSSASGASAGSRCTPTPARSCRGPRPRSSSSGPRRDRRDRGAARRRRRHRQRRDRARDRRRASRRRRHRHRRLAEALALAPRTPTGSGSRSSWSRRPARGLEGPFDLVVSNPPYVGADELDALEPEVRDWEPRLALVGDGRRRRSPRRHAACSPTAARSFSSATPEGAATSPALLETSATRRLRHA